MSHITFIKTVSTGNLFVAGMDGRNKNQYVSVVLKREPILQVSVDLLHVKMIELWLLLLLITLFKNWENKNFLKFSHLKWM